MKTVRISLNSIDKVKSFVNDLTKFDVDFDLVSGRYVIDAKSIMGIFSLDLSKPIDLNIHAEAESSINEILTVLAPYIIHQSISYAFLKGILFPGFLFYFSAFYCLPAFDHFYGLQRSLHQLIDLLRQIFL